MAIKKSEAIRSNEEEVQKHVKHAEAYIDNKIKGYVPSDEIRVTFTELVDVEVNLSDRVIEKLVKLYEDAEWAVTVGYTSEGLKYLKLT